jgi:hypothetical protein
MLHKEAIVGVILNEKHVGGCGGIQKASIARNWIRTGISLGF